MDNNYEVFVQPEELWEFYSKYKDRFHTSVAELATDFSSGLSIVLSDHDGPTVSAVLEGEPLDWEEITKDTAAEEYVQLLEDYIYPVEIVHKTDSIQSVVDRREDDLAFAVESLVDDFTDTTNTLDADEVGLLINEVAKLLTSLGFSVYRPMVAEDDTYCDYPYEYEDLYLSAEDFDDGDEDDNDEE